MPIPCTVTKQFADYYVGQEIEVDEDDYNRLFRVGRVRPLNVPQVDRSKVNAIPPTPDEQRPGQVAPTRKFICEDRRGKKKQQALAPGASPTEPTVVFTPKAKVEAPPMAKPDGPTRDKRERVPAQLPVGPDLGPSTGPDETKAAAPVVKIVGQGNGWHHVVIDGELVRKESGQPKNFRLGDAETLAENIRAGRVEVP